MDSTMEELYNACQVGLPVILFVQVFQKAGSSSQVHEEAEEAHEREGVDGVGEQQEEEEGDWEVMRHLEVLLSLVLLMREKETQRL
jgi:hypothetical protein